MQVFQHPTDRPRTSSVVAIGSFDGLHLGHQALIAALVDSSRAHSVPSVVFTFDQPTRVLLEGSKYLYTLPEKLEILRGLGVDEVIAVPFGQRVLALVNAGEAVNVSGGQTMA